MFGALLHPSTLIGLFASMSSEGPRWGKLTQLMPNHIFRHIDWDMPSSIVDSDRMSNHLREDRRVA
jgi:hypothetical protein